MLYYYYIKKFSRCLILRQLSPFDWKCLQIAKQRAKDLRKNELIYLKSTSVKKGRAKSKKTPKFGAGAIFKNCKIILKAKKMLVH